MAREVPPTVDAALITWNSHRVVTGPLAGLLSDSLRTNLILVDNNSSDKSVSLVENSWSGSLTKIENATNVGFSRALAQAFAAGSGEYFLMINPDITLKPDVIEHLVRALEQNPQFNAAGPRITRPDSSEEYAAARRLPGIGSELARALMLHRRLQGTRLDPYSFPSSTYARSRPVPCLSGSLMLIRRCALENAGGVDTRLFMYFEDLDLCKKLGGEDGRLLYCAEVRAEHVYAGSSERTPEIDAWLQVQSEAALGLYFETYASAGSRVVQRLIAIFGALLRLLGARVSSRLSREGVRARLRWLLLRRETPMPDGLRG
ncbi:glycosyltransferase [Thermoleophilia bacterium SCSIO 60948]|nr:glycosyltransferase [Thermoleophilia bacterium SCSIO 60948]